MWICSDSCIQKQMSLLVGFSELNLTAAKIVVIVLVYVCYTIIINMYSTMYFVLRWTKSIIYNKINKNTVIYY